MNITKDTLRILSHHSGALLENITGDTLLQDLLFDSLDYTSLLIRLEDYFDIDIPDDHASDLITVSDLVDYIKVEVLDY